MATRSLPDLLRSTLQSHLAEADLQDDQELRNIMDKLNKLSSKVAETKARALAQRSAKNK
ncbi:hypothetical protein OPS25_04670 [Alteromonas ponticola]|uniref:Uncharacterized protein n=1 Tax=Alteromonas aquimaris TaxID=2998417 RepID=A0ABT3P6T7_9ALTE|nr:hypothetical protein [Alteromonas aquimaris]MCW8107791.1 hypothetical protein [Alteromonas aquimaris]